ncbi:hypothetical protein Tco_1520772 [Tanacetum coccineum]
MRTRSQSRNSNRQQQQVNPTFVEPFNLIEPIPVVTMDDTRTMAQLLEAPTVGYEDAIVVPEITAENFELKHVSVNRTTSKSLFEVVYGRNLITPLDLVPVPEVGRFGKLKPRGDGPFRVLKNINDNAYKIELPGHYNVSATFNVADLSPYKGDSDDEPDSG